MPLPIRLALLSCLLAPAAATLAQVACPALPPQSTLQWEHKVQAGFIVCRAMSDGRQVFGLMLSQDKPELRLARSNRAEPGAFGGHGMYWYKPDAAGTPVDTRRVAVVELGEDRYAQIWIDATTEAEIPRLQGLVQGLQLR